MARAKNKRDSPAGKNGKAKAAPATPAAAAKDSSPAPQADEQPSKAAADEGKRKAEPSSSSSSSDEEGDDSFEDAGSVAGSSSHRMVRTPSRGNSSNEEEEPETPKKASTRAQSVDNDDDASQYDEEQEQEQEQGEGTPPAATTPPASTTMAEETGTESAYSDHEEQSRSIQDDKENQFLLQRLDAQNNALQRDPRARTASMEGTQKLRQSFARLQREQVGDPSTDWDFWGKVMADYEQVASQQPKELSRAIQQGIPAALRGMTWQLMAASKDQSLETIYSELLKETSPHEKVIARDLSRTFPRHEYFQPGGVGQENLFNICKAYSIYDEEVGYTQGLQFIVGPMLLNMPDEEAFCLLVRLMKTYDLRSHYVPNMPGLQLRLFQFDRLLEELLPSVFMHLLRQGVKSSMYASQWFLTLFGYRFPIELVCAVFDLVFAEGVEAVFRFAIAILKRAEHQLLTMEFEQCIDFLKDRAFEAYAPSTRRSSVSKDKKKTNVVLADSAAEDEESLYDVQAFVKEALSIKITPLMLDQFGEEWENLCREQNAHNVEIESLRRANAHLSAQVRQLESSLAQLNREHVDLVKQVVTTKIEKEEIEEELVKYKIAFADLSHQQAERRLSERQFSMSTSSSSSGGAVPMNGFGADQSLS